MGIMEKIFWFFEKRSTKNLINKFESEGYK